MNESTIKPIYKLGKHNKLSADVEYSLAMRYNENADQSALNQLVSANLRFVAHIATGYLGYGLVLEDIIQEGNVGLIKAINRFDPTRGVRLVSFAVHSIKAEIHEYVLKNCQMVKVATTKPQRKLFFNLRKHKKTIGWLSEKDAIDISKKLDVDLLLVYEMEMRLNGKDIPFNASSDDSDDEYIVSPESYILNPDLDPSKLVENEDWVKHTDTLLLSGIKTLDERSQFILNNRWFNEPKMTLHDLAGIYNISAERVRQLEKNAMIKIKNYMEELK